MALLLILLALFGFVFAGIGGGSTSSSGSAGAIVPPTTRSTTRATSTPQAAKPCRAPRIKGASAPSDGCSNPPANP